MDTAIAATGIASAAFVTSHLGLSHPPVRNRIVERIGEQGFLGFYSAVSLVMLIAMITAYAHASHYVYLWIPGHGLRHLPLLFMPLAFILIAGGMAMRNPSAVGMESSLDQPSPASGVLRITRHPVMWGMLLWSAVHILANGDLASLLFFGGFLLTAGLGSLHLDQRMALIQGERWQRFAAVTSHIPFVAIISGRQSWSWSELLRPTLLGLALFIILLASHSYLFGVRPY
ncbi:MAG: NnrU family protein [Synechococcaceae cyanobacterium SM1_2_3]|nr:NnrU family protein [Synechococcaceae cyanobacterium SM1_2_3]